jgi:hypothetical protein
MRPAVLSRRRVYIHANWPVFGTFLPYSTSTTTWEWIHGAYWPARSCSGCFNESLDLAQKPLKRLDHHSLFRFVNIRDRLKVVCIVSMCGMLCTVLIPQSSSCCDSLLPAL